jgi:hypothetical protein
MKDPVGFGRALWPQPKGGAEREQQNGGTRRSGAPFRLFDLSAKRLAFQYNLRDAY